VSLEDKYESAYSIQHARAHTTHGTIYTRYTHTRTNAHIHTQHIDLSDVNLGFLSLTPKYLKIFSNSGSCCSNTETHEHTTTYTCTRAHSHTTSHPHNLQTRVSNSNAHITRTPVHPKPYVHSNIRTGTRTRHSPFARSHKQTHQQTHTHYTTKHTQTQRSSSFTHFIGCFSCKFIR